MLRITLGEIRSRVLFFFFHVLLPSLSSLRSESGVAETGRREKIVEGNIPLSPFRCYVSKTSNISRSSDSVQCRTISQPSSFVFTGAVNKSAHPPADATILFPSFLLGRRRCSLERRSLSLSLSRPRRLRITVFRVSADALDAGRSRRPVGDWQA